MWRNKKVHHSFLKLLSYRWLQQKGVNLPPAPKLSSICPTPQRNLVFHSCLGGANHSQVLPKSSLARHDLTEHAPRPQCFCSQVSLSRPRILLLSSWQPSSEIPPPFQSLLELQASLRTSPLSI